MLDLLKTENRETTREIVISICIFTNHSGMEAGIRKDRKGLFSGLKPSMPFLFLSVNNMGS